MYEKICQRLLDSNVACFAIFVIYESKSACDIMVIEKIKFKIEQLLLKEM